MAVSSSFATHLMPIDPRVYCETMNELHSYITSSKRGYLTQAELFRYYRQRHNNAEIPYRILGYRSLLDLLSSDQRLFSIDLRREPAYIYSAVKLRQQKRERRQCGTTFFRQHHSTNTIGEHHVMHPDYIFFDHYVPFNEQRQNVKSINEQEFINQTQNNHSAVSDTARINTETDVWYTPELHEPNPLIENKINPNMSNKEAVQCEFNSFSPTLNEINDNRAINMCETEYKLVQRKIKSDSNDNDENNHTSDRDSTVLKTSVPYLNKSISTSTTSLSTLCCWNLTDWYILLLIIVLLSILLSIYLLTLC